LVIVDRTEDMFSCASHGGQPGWNAPLAHRILSTIRQAIPTNESTGPSQLTNDVEILPTTLSAHIEGISTASGSVLDRPFSAVSGLPLSLKPSIFVDTDAGPDMTALQLSILAGTEEQGKIRLCDALKAAIIESKAVGPAPKKRGLGAEVLALVQSLTAAPATATESKHSSEHRNAYNVDACIQYQSLLAVALAVVEAMQRSSNKQFYHVCPWRCSYDTRAAREAELDTLIGLKGKSMSQCMHFIADSVSSKKQIAPTAVSGAKPQQTDDSGVTDLIHIFLQITR